MQSAKQLPHLPLLLQQAGYAGQHEHIAAAQQREGRGLPTRLVGSLYDAHVRPCRAVGTGFDANKTFGAARRELGLGCGGCCQDWATSLHLGPIDASSHCRRQAELPKIFATPAPFRLRVGMPSARYCEVAGSFRGLGSRTFRCETQAVM